MTPEEYYRRLEEEMVLARARARAARAASELPPAYSLLPPASSLLTAPPVAGGPGYAVYVGRQPGAYVTWYVNFCFLRIRIVDVLQGETVFERQKECPTTRIRPLAA